MQAPGLPPGYRQQPGPTRTILVESLPSPARHSYVSTICLQPRTPGGGGGGGFRADTSPGWQQDYRGYR